MGQRIIVSPTAESAHVRIVSGRPSGHCGRVATWPTRSRLRRWRYFGDCVGMNTRKILGVVALLAVVAAVSFMIAGPARWHGNRPTPTTESHYRVSSPHGASPAAVAVRHALLSLWTKGDSAVKDVVLHGTTFTPDTEHDIKDARRYCDAALTFVADVDPRNNAAMKNALSELSWAVADK